jgi:hypothetical protein
MSGWSSWLAGHGRSTTSDAGVRRSRLVASAPFVASVSALLLNDHLLKRAWSGWVTGKLSDVAGVAMVALGLTALLRCRTVAFVATVVAFTLLKTVPTVTEWAAAVIGGRTLTDPTDLLALAVLVPLWVWVGPAPPSALASSPMPVPGPRARPTWIVPVQVAAIGFAVVATTGSSCGPQGLFDVRAIDGVVYARADLDVWTSADGGATWQSSDVDAFDDRFDARPDRPVCAGERCYDIVGSRWDSDVTVVETLDGDSVDVLTVSSADRREFDDRFQPTCGGSMLTALAVVEIGDVVNLVVDMGEAGVLHRGSDGTWEWVGVGVWGIGEGDVADGSFLGHEIASRPDRGPLASAWLARTLLLGAPVAALAAAAPLGVLAARRGRSAVAAVLIAALLALVLMAPTALLLALLSDASPGRIGSYVTAGVVLLLIAAVGIGLLVLWFRRSARRTSDEPAWPSPPPPPTVAD